MPMPGKSYLFCLNTPGSFFSFREHQFEEEEGRGRKGATDGDRPLLMPGT